MTHTYNLRAQQSHRHSSPQPTTQTATTRRAKTAQKELAPSNPQKKVTAQGHPRRPTRQSKRSRPAESSEERARKRCRPNVEPSVLASGSHTRLPKETFDLPPPPTRHAKRDRPAEPSEGRVRKRRRPNAESANLDVSSQTKLPEQRSSFKRSAAKLNHLRRDATDVWRIVVQTEELIARASTSARCLLSDVMHLDARCEESPVQRGAHEARSVQIESSTEKVDTVSSMDEQQPDDARKVAEGELKTLIASFKSVRSKISGNTAKAFSSDDLRTLSTLCDDWGEENPAWHDCRCSAKQRNRTTAESFPKPRPRVGVDQQGLPFHDWSACPHETWPPRRMGKERIVMGEVGILFNRTVVTDALVLPAPLRPRRPRAFDEQYRPQFHDITRPIYRILERWHRVYGRCLQCILRAIRSFPTWMIEVDDTDGFVDGNPVFINLLNDELAEWDETSRRWRILVQDHYSWIPVQELETKPSDSAADPKVVNGTATTQVPYNHWSWA
ncbi:hypothetical protein PUNSTDRAFT_145341 [Punctularia strigosozonata HHB-11173 SS5]|uniref:uncharacterized protein n=1 Tax=Punctularia strigosozonata (strain HHB-11173) TaxID=741275 RepID=UPI0004416329|nr:uncharacterized protein PUNSTDRAFT_145341 [Punctularia strigosozonata HHB-11173 SS5]EIN06914.1 hypothetical protein PUNSTDRAFT_145341 [Punctularia strigosozonata HHB-11173 SS5]